MQASPTSHRDRALAVLVLLLPLILLADSIFGGRTYQPFDIAEFPPIGDTLTAAQRSELRNTANYDATEAPIWFRAEVQMAREALANGRLPLWNGAVRGGAPMLAHGHLGWLNPLHWPALLFANPDHGLLYLTAVMLGLAGLLMFGLLRCAGLSGAAATFGAVAFAWSGTMTANGHWFMRLEPLAMLPGLCWAMLAASRREGRQRALPTLGLASATAAVWLSGFPQYGIPVTLLAAGFGAVLCLRELQRSPRAAFALAGWLLLGGAVGMLLAMPQLVPMLHFYPDSNRPIDETLDRASRHAWSAAGFLGYLFPDVFSHPGDIRLPQDSAPLPWLLNDLRHWQTGEALLPNYNATEYAIFPGTPTVLLTLLGVCAGGPRWRWLPVAGLAAVWLLATGAFGAHLTYLLPGIKSVPPYRFAGPACALVAILAAVGLDRLRTGLAPWLLRTLAVVWMAFAGYCLAESTHSVAATRADDPWLARIVERHREAYAAARNVPIAAVTPAAALQLQFTTRDREDPRISYDAIALGRERLAASLQRTGWWAAALSAALFALSLRRRELPAWLLGAATLVTATELYLVGQPRNAGQAMPYPHDSAVHAFLREQRDRHADAGGFVIARGAGRAGPWNLPGGTLANERIRDLNFYTFVDKWSDRPIRSLYGDAQILRGFVCDALPDDERLRRPWWDLFGLRYVLATQPMQHAGREVLRLPTPDAPQVRPYHVYERDSALPRAWFVPALDVVADETQLLARLTATDLDPRRAALVLAADAPTTAWSGASPTSAERTIRFVEEDAASLSLEIGAGAPGYLVLADTYFAGWTATLDGEPTPIVRGNLYQRVVAVGPAAARLEFRYLPPGLAGGAGLGALGLALVAALGALAWRNRAAVGRTAPATAV